MKKRKNIKTETKIVKFYQGKPLSEHTPKRVRNDITRRLIDYLRSHYEMRYNTVQGYTELRPLGAQSDFLPADERMRNTIAIQARLDGIDVWDKDIRRYTESNMVKPYNPIRDYLDSVRGRWDGHDHIGDLADCVPVDVPSWREWFHTWMLGMVAQWMGLDATHGNSVAPLLISKQGFCKSTFCKRLLPDALQWGYNDNLIISEKRNLLLAMSQYLLINIDEFNAVAPNVQAGFLKNVLQLANVKIKRPYALRCETLPRTASFIATANMADVLTDPSGCRRFIAVTLTAPISLPSRLDYIGLYAQAVDELEAGRRYWFDEADTQAIIANNRRYRQRIPVEAFFFDSFAIPPTESAGTYMTAAAIFARLKQQVGSQLRLSALSHFGRVLANIDGLKSKHTTRGTEYLVAVR